MIENEMKITQETTENEFMNMINPNWNLFFRIPLANLNQALINGNPIVGDYG